MLKIFADMWRKPGVMGQAVKTLAEMVREAEYVYTRAWEVCRGQAPAASAQEPVKEHDKTVNRYERDIRRMLVEHLTINPGVDVSGCLAIMVMAKDAERLGDHARNIFGVAQRVEGQLEGMRYFPELNAMSVQIAQLFPMLSRAILDSGEEQAHAILLRYQDLKKELRQIQKRLFEGNLSGAEAVVTTLLIRDLVRINAHTGNIASGIIFPIEDIDFVSRGLKKQQAES